MAAWKVEGLGRIGKGNAVVGFVAVCVCSGVGDTTASASGAAASASLTSGAAALESFKS